ncbi:ras-related protein Rab-32 [Orycteropus afer afer]|uniref:Ras-related protein Rab-32 n=1 Tax=Orycteropus afer afer TaxID=1230840 RepID=A0AC54ZAC8_ORYAF|nr:ras-related protein Rab-32 [Orycteropus afer afer]
MAAGVAAEVLETREHLFKVLVIGELGVGKTSIIKRYVHQLFSQHYRATIGVDFALKVLNWDSRTLVRLQLWDIAGQERFGNMTRVYYKDAVGAFIVFDISRGSTFEAVLKWKTDLDSKIHLPNGSPIPAVLLANKCDQKKEDGHSPPQMDQFCKEHGFSGWFETSAKELVLNPLLISALQDNINIDEAARFLVENILANHQSFPNEEDDVDKIKLDRDCSSKGASTSQSIPALTLKHVFYGKEKEVILVRLAEFNIKVQRPVLCALPPPRPRGLSSGSGLEPEPPLEQPLEPPAAAQRGAALGAAPAPCCSEARAAVSRQPQTRS